MISGHVYFVRRADGEGPVKIGCSAVPVQRLSHLMAWAPYPLTVVATIPGDGRLERRFHAAFREQHSHREWFAPSPALEDCIARVLAGTFDIAELPEPRSLYNGRFGAKIPPGQILRQRLSRNMHLTGFDAPADLKVLVREFETLGEAARVEVRERVDAFLADPRAAGTLLPYTWAQKAYAIRAAKRGWAPIQVAA